MGRIAVFGYGSLADPESAARTLGREVAGMEIATLTGWRRRWSCWRDNLAHEKTFAVEPGGELPPAIVGLNVEPAEPGEAGPNGVLIEVTEADLVRLDVREMRYDRVDVSGCEEPTGSFERVVAYTAKPAHSTRPPEGAVIMAPYVRTVEAAFDALGPGQLDAFRDTTGPLPAPAVDARLVRDDIPPGNPRDW